MALLGLLQKNLGNELTSHLKEAVTFILNEEFFDLMGAEDQGYAIHKDLRLKLTKIWRETKNFEKFLTKSFPIVREWGKVLIQRET